MLELSTFLRRRPIHIHGRSLRSQRSQRNNQDNDYDSAIIGTPDEDLPVGGRVETDHLKKRPRADDHQHDDQRRKRQQQTISTENHKAHKTLPYIDATYENSKTSLGMDSKGEVLAQRLNVLTNTNTTTEMEYFQRKIFEAEKRIIAVEFLLSGKSASMAPQDIYEEIAIFETFHKKELRSTYSTLLKEKVTLFGRCRDSLQLFIP